MYNTQTLTGFEDGKYAKDVGAGSGVTKPSNYTKGAAPLQALPAQWWNWLNQQFTEKFNNATGDLSIITAEIKNAILGAGIAIDPTDNEQLKKAILALTTVIATTSSIGVVKADATTDGGINVDNTGLMTVNGWSNVKNDIGDLTNVDSSKTVTNLANAIGSLNNPGISYQGTHAWNVQAGRTSLVDQINFILTQISGAVVGIGVITQSSTESPSKDTRYIVKNGATLTLNTPAIDYQRIEVVAYGTACTLVFPDPSGTSKTIQMVADSSIELYTKINTGYITGVYGALWN